MSSLRRLRLDRLLCLVLRASPCLLRELSPEDSADLSGHCAQCRGLTDQGFDLRQLFFLLPSVVLVALVVTNLGQAQPVQPIPASPPRAVDKVIVENGFVRCVALQAVLGLEVQRVRANMFQAHDLVALGHGFATGQLILRKLILPIENGSLERVEGCHFGCETVRYSFRRFKSQAEKPSSHI